MDLPKADGHDMLGQWIDMNKKCTNEVREGWLVAQVRKEGGHKASKMIMAQDTAENILLRDSESSEPFIFNLKHHGRELKKPKIDKMLQVPALLKDPLDHVQDQFFSISVETNFHKVN